METAFWLKCWWVVQITFELTVKQLLSFDPGQWSENLRKEYLQLIDGFFSLPVPLPFTTYGKALKVVSFHLFILLRSMNICNQIKQV